MNILAIDTSGNWLTVVCGDADGVKASFSEQIGNQHSERVVGVVSEVLAKAGIQLSDLGLAGVVAGPGSFTGLRVGISFVKGLAIALGIRTAGINSLDALAHAALGSGSRFVSPVIDARKGQLYAALYDVGGQAPRLCSDHCAVAPAEWFARLTAGTLVLGSGVETYRELIKTDFKHLAMLENNIATISPEVFYSLAKNAIPMDPMELDACYIREADAVCKPKQR